MELTFDGVDLRQAVPNAFVEHFPDFVHAEKDIQTVHVPGKNGDVIFDDGSFRNVLISYDIAIKGSMFINQSLGDFQDELYAWMHPSIASDTGYYTLADSQNIHTYRLAYAYGGIQFKNIYGRNTRGRITFCCRPEKFFREMPSYDFTTTSGTIDNRDYFYPAHPSFTVICRGSGAFAIYKTDGNMYRVQIDDVTGTLYLDGDTQDAYLGDGTNMNSHITLTGVGTYPVLEPGIVQQFARTGDISEVMINPRYYTI